MLGDAPQVASANANPIYFAVLSELFAGKRAVCRPRSAAKQSTQQEPLHRAAADFRLNRAEAKDLTSKRVRFIKTNVDAMVHGELFAGKRAVRRPRSAANQSTHQEPPHPQLQPQPQQRAAVDRRRDRDEPQDPFGLTSKRIRFTKTNVGTMVHAMQSRKPFRYLFLIPAYWV